MSIKDAVKAATEKSIPVKDNMTEFSNLLSRIGICDFCYQSYCNYDNDKFIREINFISSKVGSIYLNMIDSFDESYFSENNFFFKDSTIYNVSFFETHENKISEIIFSSGIIDSIVFTFYKPEERKTEVFWFLSNDKSCNRVSQHYLKENGLIHFLMNFIFYFRKEFKDFIASSKLTEGEITRYLPEFRLRRDMGSVVQKLRDPASEISLDKYHLGYPFNQALTFNETNILVKYFKGATAKEIAQELKVSYRTIEKHIELIRHKTDLVDWKLLRKALFSSPYFMAILDLF